ncbi:histone acetyltransferase type B catalytic subunit [Lactifluus volemus]|nr:histone acetyltransferase type B catalytic subunit [Lactifluus volemus]
MANWTADSNDALHLSLVRANDDKEVLGDNESYENFHPTFTYPIYGEDEKIYGYTDLVIDLRFTSGSLSQFLNITYSAKLPTSSTLDDGYYQSEAEFLAHVEKDASSFRPLGKKIHSYTRVAPNSAKKGKGTAITISEDDPDAIVFEAWHVTWSTPGFREYHRRMQLFILLYIEAGSYINDEEDSWEFVVLSRKRRTTPVTETYHFLGYSSLYPFYCFPDKLRLRLRYTTAALYNAIYQHVLTRPSITELTVEDPAEAFEDLRDRNDLAMLLGHPPSLSHGGGRVGRTPAKSKTAGKLGPPADRAWLERWRKELKIAGRQFHRLVEMLIQLHLNPADTRAAKAYRLQVKERLYRFNYEMLIQLDEKDRIEKLEETFQTVREDYQRILATVR